MVFSTGKAASLSRDAHFPNTIMNTKKFQNDVIRAAFLEAKTKEAPPFRLKGRGHEPRVLLNRSTAAILRGVDLPRVAKPGYGAKFYYPYRLVRRAADKRKCAIAGR
jgi:hypothetical protein